jgi:glucokinase
MQIIGVDLGGTNMRAGLVADQGVAATAHGPVKPGGSQQEILDDLMAVISRVHRDDVQGIGVGVPSVVDTERGIAYDVINIPSWQEVPIGSILHDRFHVPVYVNNDANCFAAGEKYFGQAHNFRDSVGLILGTGLGAGLILNDKLYNGANCGAGEFGMIPYQDSILEHYCSGQFFQRHYERSGESLARLASQGNDDALEIFTEFGRHLSAAIKIILYSVDPQIIVLGGSVSGSFSYYEKALWTGLQSFAYTRSLKHLRIERSVLAQAAILGAAALYLDAKK